jgi:hypothetical protein
LKKNVALYSTKLLSAAKVIDFHKPDILGDKNWESGCIIQVEVSVTKCLKGQREKNQV